MLPTQNIVAFKTSKDIWCQDSAQFKRLHHHIPTALSRDKHKLWKFKLYIIAGWKDTVLHYLHKGHMLKFELKSNFVMPHPRKAGVLLLNIIWWVG